MSLFDRVQRVCVAICTPMPMRNGVYDTISVRWHRSRMGLRIPTNFNTCEMLADGLEVGDARSRVVAQVLTTKPVPEFILWLDYDVLMPPDALTKLFFRARTLLDYDIYAGVYCLKNLAHSEPLIYGELGQGPIWNWKVGDLLTTESHGVKSVHSGLTLVRTSLYRKLLDAGLVGGQGDDQEDRPFYRTNIEKDMTLDDGRQVRTGGTEDIYFCNLVDIVGGKILVDTSVLAGHEDKNTGIIYGLPYIAGGPVDRAKWLVNRDGDEPDRKEAEAGGLKLALDIGAGAERRKLDGYVVYTTDIRADVNPDYIQDSRLLNLPDDHFDLTTSEHHLEHMGRFDQEHVWENIFRITRPGGRTEHLIPNIEWAAKMIADGEMEDSDQAPHIMNVLYGSQEAAVGVAREYNSHHFGYTPAIAKALAESAGFVDVTVESYKDRPELLYNLLVKGVKPERKVIDVNPIAEEIETDEDLPIAEEIRESNVDSVQVKETAAV